MEMTTMHQTYPPSLSVHRPEVVKYLIENHRGSISKISFNCLHWAIANRSFELVKYLVDNGAEINAKVGTDKNQSIHIAASAGCFEIVNYLIEKGAEVNCRNKKNRAAGCQGLVR